MRIVFLGVGEACDQGLINTSLLVQAKDATLLLDCGFNVAPRALALCKAANVLDAVWISHFHGDHFFGLPQLLLGLWQQGRNKPLHLVCRAGGREKVLQAAGLAYPNLLQKLGFELLFHEVQQGQSMELLGLHWAFAETEHPEPNLALGLHSRGKSIYFSGDGKSGLSGLDMARDCNLLVHEAYLLHAAVPGHSSVQECLELAGQCRCDRLALVHIQMQERQERKERILAALQSAPGLQAFMPEPGQELAI
ncbi:MAG: MBL fold metallo-hydrolase [Thermodesulfobacteriota bacterium]